MHFSSRIPKKIKSPEEVISALNEHPLTREAAIKMIRDGVELEFLKLESKGFGLPTNENTEGYNGWRICVNYQLTKTEKEEIIWHELVHLHLRRIFGHMINDNGEGSEEIHPLITDEGKKLAGEKPISYQELLNFMQK